MSPGQYYNEYLNVQVSTSNKVKLIILLYERAVFLLQNARDLNGKDQIRQRCKNIVKAQEIILELLSALNFQAGEVAKSLHSLYVYFYKRLNDAIFKKDTKALDEIIRLLNLLKESWIEISNHPDIRKKNTVPQQTSMALRSV
ncbi:flagellar export chaperone FliS [candidate division KSB1 bacterium]|nr:flagellar export chaperone FliS [bacterium]OQX58274.1 MAG: flagellar export chaperone FliS [candidate division KSB1 bacterium 4484_219]RKY76700.1 MAG: flagellar export chaperone FliS [candidate division KSB1 bacterium]HDI52374.1 flagellar export chaperone FliS [Bacteroidota bacterium]RKY83496.1 MAG: flagellar export chaperone FliS [candidate division KSB1 bacterium]